MIHYGLDRQATGIGRYTQQLTSALEALGIIVYPLWAGKQSTDGRGETLRGSYRLPGLLSVGQVEIARAAKRLGLDVVHDPTGAMSLTLTSAKRVVTIHDAIPHIFPETSTRLDWLIYHVWLPRAVRMANAIVTDSSQSQEDIVTHMRAEREAVSVIAAAADKRFRPLPFEEVDPVLAEYGVSRPYILYVGALESRKNLPRLLEAYAQLRRWSTNWKLVIVGARKWKFSPIFDTVQSLQLEPYVTFTGYVEDDHLPALYAGADLFAFPSLYEGFGLPVLEAMACGTPVVTSNTSSLPEVAGDAALLVDPESVGDIAAAMQRVLGDTALAAELRAKGIERAAQFTWERTARETLAVYERVLAESS